MTKAEAGRLGGLATFQKYGSTHMAMIGRKGYRTTTTRYQVLPGRINKWVMLKRETNEIVSIW